MNEDGGNSLEKDAFEVVVCFVVHSIILSKDSMMSVGFSNDLWGSIASVYGGKAWIEWWWK